MCSLLVISLFFFSIVFILIAGVCNRVAVQFFAVKTELRAFVARRIVGSFALGKVRQLRVRQFTTLLGNVGDVRDRVTRILTLALRRAVRIRGRIKAFTNLLLRDRADGLLRNVGRFTVTAGRVFSIYVIVDSSLGD